MVKVSPAIVNSNWGSPHLEHAERLHTEYLKALYEWIDFSRDHGNAFFLWKICWDLLERSESSEDDQIDKSSLKEALDLEKWTVAMDSAFKLEELSPKQVDYLENELDLRLTSETDEEATEPTRASENFLEFGWTAVDKRLVLEVRAKILIDYLRLGECQCGYPCPVQDKPLHERSPFDFDAHTDGGHDPSNPFAQEFAGESYLRQVEIARHLLTGLGETDQGKEFLADLFSESDPLFDPEAFFDPPSRGSGDNVVQIRDDYAKVLFEQKSDGWGAFKRGAGGGPPNPELESDLSLLSGHLATGASHYYTQNTDSSDAKDALGTFSGLVYATFLTDDAIDTALSGTGETWGDDETKLSEVKAWSRDASSWSVGDSIKLAAKTHGVVDDVLDARGLGGTGITGSLQVMFSCYNIMGSGLKAVEGDSKDALEAVAGGAKAIGSLSAIDGIFVEDLEKVSREADNVIKQFGSKAIQFCEALGPVFDMIDVHKNLYAATVEYGSGDYDAAAAKALSMAGGAMTLTAGMANAMGYTAIAGVGLTGIGIAAALVGIAAMIIYNIVDDSAIIEWAKQTFFGSNWYTHSVEDLANPTGTTAPFRYMDDEGFDIFDTAPPKQVRSNNEDDILTEIEEGGVNFVPQIQDFMRLVRPLNVTTAEMKTDSHSNGASISDAPVGRLTIDPEKAHDPENQIFADPDWGTPDTRVDPDSWLALEPIEVIEGPRGVPLAQDRDIPHFVHLGDEYTSQGTVDPGNSVLSLHQGRRWSPDNDENIHFTIDRETDEGNVMSTTVEFWNTKTLGRDDDEEKEPRLDLFNMRDLSTGSQGMMLYHIPIDSGGDDIHSMLDSGKTPDQIRKNPMATREFTESMTDNL